jgi:hypothetical protein
MSDTTSIDVDVFLDELAHELRLRGVPAFRSELRQWVRATWPLIADDPSPGRRATARLEQHRDQPAGAD